jgi:small conductance mechanosensitive channel
MNTGGIMNFALDPEMIKNLQPIVIAYAGKGFAALLIFIIGKWIARWMTNIFIRLMKSRDVDVTLIKFLEGIIYYALLASVIIAAAGQLGIKTTSFVAVLGAASLAIGLALKDSLSNFHNRMFILFKLLSRREVTLR